MVARQQVVPPKYNCIHLLTKRNSNLQRKPSFGMPPLLIGNSVPVLSRQNLRVSAKHFECLFLLVIVVPETPKV